MTDYAELRRLVLEAGLLDRQPAYYVRQVLLVLGCYALAVVLLAARPGGWTLVGVAALSAFAFAQVAFLGHDASHHQIFARRRREDAFCLLCNLLIGFSYSWWADKHTRHHRAPNQVGVDPDMDVPLLAFCEEQAREATGVRRAVIRVQAYVFPLMLLFEGIALRVASVAYLWRGGGRFPVTESAFLALHVAGYAALVFTVLPWRDGVLLVALHQALFGLYLGTVFAPNHKGMRVIASDSQLDALQRQLQTSRNVRSHPLTDVMFGGLNFQIEHHLFPRIPRGRLKEARRLVGAFCLARDLPYHEVGFWDSCRETLTYLSRMGASARRPRAAIITGPGDRAAGARQAAGE